MTQEKISRRGFLKVSCAGAAALGMTVCGAAAIIPDSIPIELEEFTYGDKAIEKKILVAYATYAGSTFEVACAIGESIGCSGNSVEVKPIKEAPLVDNYDAVVIGSAVQNGNWLPEAVNFVKTNQDALSQVPVALFSVHIQNTADDENSRKNRKAYLDEVRWFVEPVSEGFFAGKFDRRGAALLLPGLVARFVPPIDLRKWEKIYTWAQNIQPILQRA